MDSDIRIPIRWYFVDPSTPFLQFRTPFNSRDFTTDKTWWPDLGEVHGAPRRFVRGNPLPPLQRPLLGDPGQWLGGLIWANVFQRAAAICYCPSITSSAQGEDFAIANLCACSELSADVVLDVFVDVDVCSCTDLAGPSPWPSFDVCACSDVSSETLPTFNVESDVCACCDLSSEILGDFLVTSDLCSCAELSVTHVGTGNSYTSDVCACADLAGPSPWPTFNVCACSEVTASHVP